MYLKLFLKIRFRIIEEISEDLANQKINNMLNNLDFGLAITLTFLMVMLISFFTIVLIERSAKSVRRKNWLENLWKKLWNLRAGLTALGIFVFFFELYLWFVQLMIQNNIKTNKASSHVFKNDKII